MQGRAIYIEAPEDIGMWEKQPGCPSLFLAGGITECPNWQSEMVLRLADEQIVLFNPRRQNFPIHDPNAAFKQIEWEHTWLRQADAILFWFPCETLCPIVLYELGAWSKDHDRKRMFVGMHPDYKRKQDVIIQTKLARPEVEVVYSLDELAAQIKYYFRGVSEAH